MKWMILCFVVMELWLVALWLAVDAVQSDFAAMRGELESQEASLSRIERELCEILADVQGAEVCDEAF